MLSPFQTYFMIQNSYSWPLDRCLKGLGFSPFSQFSSTLQMKLAHQPSPPPTPLNPPLLLLLLCHMMMTSAKMLLVELK
jgi:hypothetical protein